MPFDRNKSIVIFRPIRSTGEVVDAKYSDDTTVLASEYCIMQDGWKDLVQNDNLPYHLPGEVIEGVFIDDAKRRFEYLFKDNI